MFTNYVAEHLSEQFSPYLSNLRSLRPGITTDDLVRQRPWLVGLLLEHVQEDGSFDQEAMDKGLVRLFYSLIPEEEGMKPSEQYRLNLIIDRTIALGLMDEDYLWHQTTTKTQIAMWVDMVCSQLHIPHKWRWAEQRWRIPNLKQARSSTLNRYGRALDEELVIACFG